MSSDSSSRWSAPGPSGRDIIRGYHRKRAAVETYAERSDLSLLTASLGPETLTLVGASGPAVTDGHYASVRVLWSKRPETPADVVLVEGPVLPVDSGVLTVKTAGDWAALIGCHLGLADDRACSLHVVQLSTKKTWQINPRPGEMMVKLMVVSPTEIVLGVVDLPLTAISRKQIHRLLRLDTAKLDALAAAWP